MKKLAPSLLSADFSKLGKDVEAVEEAQVDYLHIDVMDGHFVPNISYGSVVMKSLLGKTKVPFDVHLMVEEPDFIIKDFVTDNTAFITVHQEACRHLDRTLDYIKSFGIKAGVSINPATPIETLDLILAKVDLVLIMSVNPGFGGQSYIPYCLEKVKRLKEIRETRKLEFLIEIDGGISERNIAEVMEAGVDIAVAGSAVFKGDRAYLEAKKLIDLIR